MATAKQREFNNGCFTRNFAAKLYREGKTKAEIRVILQRQRLHTAGPAQLSFVFGAEKTPDERKKAIDTFLCKSDVADATKKGQAAKHGKERP